MRIRRTRLVVAQQHHRLLLWLLCGALLLCGTLGWQCQTIKSVVRLPTSTDPIPLTDMNHIHCNTRTRRRPGLVLHSQDPRQVDLGIFGSKPDLSSSKQNENKRDATSRPSWGKPLKPREESSSTSSSNTINGERRSRKKNDETEPSKKEEDEEESVGFFRGVARRIKSIGGPSEEDTVEAAGKGDSKKSTPIRKKQSNVSGGNPSKSKRVAPAAKKKQTTSSSTTIGQQELLQLAVEARAKNLAKKRSEQKLKEQQKKLQQQQQRQKQAKGKKEEETEDEKKSWTGRLTGWLPFSSSDSENETEKDDRKNKEAKNQEKKRNNPISVGQKFLFGGGESSQKKTSEEWVTVFPKTRISPGELVPVTVAGIDLLVVSPNDGKNRLYCLANACPHLGTPLELGQLVRLPVEDGSSSAVSASNKEDDLPTSAPLSWTEIQVSSILQQDGCEDCIVCPLHKTAFALESGQVRGEWCPYPPVVGKLVGAVKPPTAAATFGVRVRGKDVQVRLNSPILEETPGDKESKR